MDGDGNRVYRKKYFWSITAKVLKLSWLFYEEGSRGAKAIKPYLEKFIGFYTTDGYVCYKVFDMTDEELAKLESPPHGGVKKRSACLVHIRRLFVNALEENYEIDPGKYISYLLGKLKTAHEGEDLTALLPCYCSL